MSLYDEIATLEDVDRVLIEGGVRESETIDYKHLKTWDKDSAPGEVAKDVSAFANSAGGLLVYGVKTRKDGDSTVPEARVGLDPALIPKVQRAITDLIRHPIPGVRWKSLPVGGPAEVLLVDVPASPLAPHQHARERVYYRREGDQSKPMPHELVELYFGRRLGPVLRPTISSPSLVSGAEGNAQGIGRCYDVTLFLENIGAGVARDVVLSFAYEEHSALHLLGVRRPQEGDTMATATPGAELVKRVSFGSQVIHPGETAHAVGLRLAVTAPLFPHEARIARLSVFADRMAASAWDLKLHRWALPAFVHSIKLESLQGARGRAENVGENDQT